MNRNRNYEPAAAVLLLVTLVILAAAPDARADFTFGEPVNLNSIIPFIDADVENPTCFSNDGLEMYMESLREGGHGKCDIWVSRRESTDQDWGLPENLGPEVNSSENENWASLSPDGLTLYFNSVRADGYGDSDVYMASRVDKDSPWQTAVNLGPGINSPNGDGCSCLSADGLEFYLSSDRPGGYGNQDIYVAKRPTANDPWGRPLNLGSAVNTPTAEFVLSLSPNGLAMFFTDGSESRRPGGYGGKDVWLTKRATLSDPWQTPVNLGPTINSPIHELGMILSPDGFTAFFLTVYPGTWDNWNNWQVPILPIVDFNGDGIVDDTDLSLMEDHWDQDYPLCDIGPMPWGDGVVNEMDKEVLLAHYGPAVDDPRLVSHWKLDETEGNLASDSQGEHDGTVRGFAVWQPSGGQFGGALQFDGIDDYVETDLAHNPCEHPFHVFAWIKGGAPGQAIVSQETGTPSLRSVWLGLDPSDGRLVSGHMHPAFPLLESNCVVTDDQWHHVGLLRDGTSRCLFVDGNEVASDSIPFICPPSTGGLRIGAGSNLESNTFWAGLIDDVRFMDPSGPHPPEIKKELEGFQIYDDDIGSDAFHVSYMAQGALDYFWDTDPAEGDYCIYWTGAARYNRIIFDFWPDKDLTQLVNEGYVLAFWVRGSGSGPDFDVWFTDTKTEDPADHPWFIRKRITTSLAPRDGQWHPVRIPLQDFTEYGSSDNGVWYKPQGDFDWAAIDGFMIRAEYGDLDGVELWFDDIRIAK